MDFADDIVLVSEGIKEAQEMLTRVEKSAKRVGLSMNTGKTKYMRYNTNQQFEIKTIDGSNLKRVEDLPRGMDRQQCKRFKNQKIACLENMSSNEESGNQLLVGQ